MATKKIIRVVTEYEMDEYTAKLFLSSSLERVINNSIRMITRYQKIPLTDNDADINLEDWEEWKPVLMTFWNTMHSRVFEVMSDTTPSTKVVKLKKGDN